MVAKRVWTQDLYRVRVELLSGEKVVDVWEKRIGLRTMKMRIRKDEWGESFAHEVNGTAIFAMGADYVPEDSLLSRRSRERTKRLLEQCARANYNTIRVWGGAFYPDDWFYELCDEYGFLVWQDFMFACATYRLTEEFEDNISHEIEENVRRIRHHACLALWCGNNEMEGMIYDGYGETPLLRGDYTRMYSYVIPKIVKRRIRTLSTGRPVPPREAILTILTTRPGETPITGRYGTVIGRLPIIAATTSAMLPSLGLSRFRR